MGNGGTLQQAKTAEDTMLRELAWLAPIGTLAVAAIVAVALATFLPRAHQRAVATWVTVAHLTCAALAAGVWLDRGFRSTMSATVQVDGPSLALTGVVGIGGAICCILAAPAVRGTDREGEFYAVLTFASLSCVVLASAADAALIAIAIGALGLATFILTGYLRGSKRANEASIKYYIFGTVSGAIMAYGLSWWFGQAGTTSLREIGVALSSAPAGIVVASTAMVLVGLFYKAAAVPFHFWTPDAYDGAPLAVAAYLSVLPKLAGLIALARVLTLALPADLIGWSTVIAIVAAATMTLGNLAALRQDNAVRLLAYSSIAQSGYMLMAVAALDRSEQALPALIYYAIAYAATNLAVFAVVIAVQREQGSVAISAFAGLGRRHPRQATALGLGLLSLVGIPPLTGFVGKLELFTASIDADQTWLAVIAVVNTVISLFYYLRLLTPAILESSEPTVGRDDTDRSGRRHGIRAVNRAATAAASAVLVFGLAAEPLLSLVDHATMLR
ncbi:NADH-quinone oxidoreductase subunit N [Patulibacter sp. NPDC049589]|uniref:NADH-quinone oxidoreductase subunit N n=1 Tax=Patulibacter sp. NPDC049589 TaxID=3154731 RepID=UPI0034171F44